MTTRDTVMAVVMVLAIVLLLAVLAGIELPHDTLLWIEIQNTGHTPLFGIIALLILGLSRRILGGRLRRPIGHYLIAFSISCGLGVLSEYVQIDGPRDADFWDFVRDVAGIVSFLGIFSFFDRGFKTAGGAEHPKFTRAALIVSILLLVVAVVPLAMLSGAYLYRNAAAPVICDFESFFEKRFYTTEDAELSATVPPSTWANVSGKVGRLKCRIGDFSGMGVREPFPGWSEYRSLRFDVYSPLDTPIVLNVRVDDSLHNDDYSDRYNGSFDVLPGGNQVMIPLSEVKSAPLLREMDMSAIHALYIFIADSNGGLVLYLDNIRLE